MRQHHRLWGIVVLFLIAGVGCAQGTEGDGDDVEAICGDNTCNGSETVGSCPQDCGSEAVCGDGSCNGSETINTCAADCSGGGNPVCGDNLCNGTETMNTCAADCGGGQGSCGDAVCNGTETTASCPVDCPPAATCGDLVCGAGEETSCPSDCTVATACGDLMCDVAGGECESLDFNCIIDCFIDDQCAAAAAPAACDHDVCTEGGPLLDTCGTCEAAVCAADDFCCTDTWDNFCVEAVATECTGVTC